MKFFFITLLLLLHFLTSTNSTISTPNIDLSSTSLDPTTTGFTITGATTGEGLGWQVSRAGDINNDGYDDMIIGAYQQNNNRGVAYVVYGGVSSLFPSTLDLSSSTALIPTSTGFTIKGNADGDQFGFSVASAGDINQDSYDDIIIGAPTKDGSRGSVYVIYGGPTATRTDIDLSTTNLLPGSTGFMVTGNLAGDLFGFSVATAGDVNNDGYADMIISGQGKNSYQGAVYVIYGKSTLSLANLDLSSLSLIPGATGTGFTITGNAVNDNFGTSVNTVGDINSDGYSDIIIGAAAKTDNTGAVYVIYGASASSLTNIDLSSTTLTPTSTGFTVTGKTAENGLGVAVSSAGDVNNDGYDDILIGAHRRDGLQGGAYVIYGGSTSTRANIDLGSESLDPASTGFAITGEFVSDVFGITVSSAGDLNKDGYDDIIVGAEFFNSYTGKAYVIYGGPLSSRVNIALSVEELQFGTTGFSITGNAGSDHFGRSVSLAGDINKDGFDDIIIGAYNKNSGRGTVYVIYGVCLLENCNLCDTRQSCKSCDSGYFVLNSQCKSCSSNCRQCSSSTVCEICESPYYLYQSQCVESCFKRTFPNSASNICEDCPSFCTTCTSKKSCQKCEEGYELSNSLCVKSSTKTSDGVATQKITTVFSSVGSLTSAGSSLFATAALVSKIIQNMRYIDTLVTDELQDIYLNWGTDLFDWDFPGSPSYSSDFRPLRELFSQYDIDSPFLANFWSNMMTIAGGLGLWISCIILKRFIDQKYKKIQAIMEKLTSGFLNFTMVQIYGGLDESLFDMILDMKNNRLNSDFSRTSLTLAILFTIFGIFLVFANFFIVHKYQKAKKDPKELEAFQAKSSYLELLYGDFNDSNYWSQSFFAFLTLRNMISSIIITTLSNYKLLQLLMLVLMDIVILTFLLTKDPLKELKEKLAQYYFEVIALIVHISVLTLCIRDSEGSTSNDSFRRGVCQTIIYVNTFLVAGSVGFMFIEIYRTINKAYKQRKRRNQNTAVVPYEVSTLNPQNSIFMDQRFMLDTMQKQERDQEEQTNLEREQSLQSILPPKLSHRERNSPVLNIKSPQPLFMNGELSLNQQMKQGVQINKRVSYQPREEQRRPVIVRPRADRQVQVRRGHSIFETLDQYHKP